MSLLFGEHRRYLADVARLNAYEAAFRKVIRPGDTVLDLGSGTGVLAVMACRAGAGQVYAVDGSCMSAVARAVMTANDLRDRVTVLPTHSLRLELPQPVDVVVGDQLGAFGLEAGVVEYYADASRRLLRPGGTLVPGAIDLVVAPLSSDPFWAEVGFWDRPASGMDVSAVSTYARHSYYYGSTEPADLLGPPQDLAHRDLSDTGAGPIEGEVELTVERSGTLHGVAGWFRAELAPGVTVSNGPGDPGRLDRSNVMLPLHTPVDVSAGAVVRFSARIDPTDMFTRWRIVVTGSDGAVVADSRHSTAEGRPMTREQLHRTHPDHVPARSRRGAARVTALGLFDAEHTVAQIENAVWENHADVFASRGEAAAFVAALVAQEAE